MLRMAFYKRQNDERGELRTRRSLRERHGLGYRSLRSAIASFFGRYGPGRDPQEFAVLAKSLREFLGHVRGQAELLGQDVPELLHLRQIAAPVVFENALENVYIEERLLL